MLPSLVAKNSVWSSQYSEPCFRNASHSSGYGVAEVGIGAADGIGVIVAVPSGKGVEVNIIGVDVTEVSAEVFWVAVIGIGDIPG